MMGQGKTGHDETKAASHTHNLPWLPSFVLVAITEYGAKKKALSILHMLYKKYKKIKSNKNKNYIYVIKTGEVGGAFDLLNTLLSSIT